MNNYKKLITIIKAGNYVARYPIDDLSIKCTMNVGAGGGALPGHWCSVVGVVSEAGVVWQVW